LVEFPQSTPGRDPGCPKNPDMKTAEEFFVKKKRKGGPRKTSEEKLAFARKGGGEGKVREPCPILQVFREGGKGDRALPGAPHSQKKYQRVKRPPGEKRRLREVPYQKRGVRGNKKKEGGNHSITCRIYHPLTRR